MRRGPTEPKGHVSTKQDRLSGPLLQPTPTKEWLLEEGKEIIIQFANAPDEEQPMILLRFQDLIKVGRGSPEELGYIKEYCLLNGLGECLRTVFSLPELIIERHIEPICFLLDEMMRGTNIAYKGLMEAEVETAMLSLVLRTSHNLVRTNVLSTLAGISEKHHRLAFSCVTDKQFHPVMRIYTGKEQYLSLIRLISSATFGGELLLQTLMEDYFVVDFLVESLTSQHDEKLLTLSVKGILNLASNNLIYANYFRSKETGVYLEALADTGKFSDSFCDLVDSLIYVLEGHIPDAAKVIEEDPFKHVKAAIKIQSIFRAYAERQKLKKSHTAAIKIQSLFRGHKVRKLVMQAKEKKKQIIQEKLRYFQAQLRIKRAERRRQYLQRATADEARIYLERERQRAAQIIQSVWRKKTERRKQQERIAQEQHNSASVIQQFWRRRKKLKEQRMDPDIQHQFTPERIQKYQRRILLQMKVNDPRIVGDYRQTRMETHRLIQQYLAKSTNSTVEYRQRLRLRTQVSNSFHSLLNAKTIDEITNNPEILMGGPLGRSTSKAIETYKAYSDRAFYEQLSSFVPKEYPPPCESINKRHAQQQQKRHTQSPSSSLQPQQTQSLPTVDSVDQTSRRKPKPRSIPKDVA